MTYAIVPMRAGGVVLDVTTDLLIDLGHEATPEDASQLYTAMIAASSIDREALVLAMARAIGETSDPADEAATIRALLEAVDRLSQAKGGKPGDVDDILQRMATAALNAILEPETGGK